MKGTYILLMYLEKEACITIGKKGNISFKKGWYVYIGSALNGLESRISRHMKAMKNHHWHIDYFIDHAMIKRVYIKMGEVREECVVASSFSEWFSYVPRFGSSDCNCVSHLFQGSKEELEEKSVQLGFGRYH